MERMVANTVGLASSSAEKLLKILLKSIGFTVGTLNPLPYAWTDFVNVPHSHCVVDTVEDGFT